MYLSYAVKYCFSDVTITCYNHRKSRNKFLKYPPIGSGNIPRFVPLVNVSRRCFTWLGAKKDESPQGGHSSRAGAPSESPKYFLGQKGIIYLTLNTHSPLSSFKAKKSII